MAFHWTPKFTQGDPFDQINWVKRDAKIGSSDGRVVFEQKNVEVPEFWSQTATDIVVSKYFSGKKNSPERENSVKQLINRVTKTISGLGSKDEYFDSPESANNFENDLKWLLVNQYASFNSPVWFNVGVIKNFQASACFILSVEDTMDSILKDWYTVEGKIFQGGSGSGINVSKIRSSKESLSKGGVASGPVSFMQGADGVANSIKSGGRTRRAAKMVALNADHPDIKNFIYCKRLMEEMSQVLAQTGKYDTSIEGKLFSIYTTLPFQNANNSVRVTDEFMEKVLNDEVWDLKAVKSGETLERVKAREILEWCADAAWHSADPGMQYDTIINKWHTCPNSGRINASNPCITGETLIATKKGLKRIKDLIGKTPEINTREDYKKPLKIWQTGTKPVYKLTTKSGYSLKVTDDHKFYVKEKGDIKAKDLKLGDKILLYGSGFGTKSMPRPLALATGYAVGDGCISEKVTRGNPALTWVGGENDISVLNQIASAINYFSSAQYPGLSVNVHRSTPGFKVVTSRPYIVEMISNYAVLNKGSINKKFTDEIFNLDKESMGEILRGLFTADGTVSGNKEKGYYVGLDSTSLELLQQVQLLLLNFGVKSKLYQDRRTSLISYLPDSKRNLKIYPVQQIHSLRITRSSRLIFEKEIGFVPDTEKALKLSLINENNEAYRDFMDDEFETLAYEGVEPVFDLTEPITNHFVANGILVHNCSEYMHLDNSACNLASLNLLRFLKNDDAFDVELFKKAVDVMILAQDILVDNSSYPTEKITQNAKNFRQLGLGFANLGSLLMAQGFPYDSDKGRAMSSAVSSIMCGEAYRMSTEIAKQKGPFSGYELNKEPMLNVIKMHREEAYKIPENLIQQKELFEEARNVWDKAILGGQESGYKNSQVTVIAPTGTIAFMMDCDTTGIEPELALIKYKKLVGGGVLRLVNNQVPRALAKLDYNPQQIEEVVNFIDKNDTIEGAPHVKDEHLPVFDCSFKAAKGTDRKSVV